MIKDFEAWRDSISENATVTNSSISGMGPVVSAQPGAIPGTTGTTGSGDLSTTLGSVYGKRDAFGEKSARKDRHSLTDYSVRNKIRTKEIGHGYSSKEFLKKIRQKYSGLNPALDFEDTNVVDPNSYANVISADTSWTKTK